ncbi:Neurofilament medium polypeptide [Frankliniella fusca]|uniref:Neurofilament medium polypeptide n=1 Tax=Frankliniella fusca TaxID=407009 RepID=A0AAE1LA40_9NEOP|nr:Neurofilament medium polypeptide [Frankliniella fusca]
MADSLSSPTGASASSEAVPQWKRDLLERRRASGRSISASSGGLGVVSLGLTCPGVVAAVRHPGPGPGLLSPAAGPGPGPAAGAGAGPSSASDFHQRARAAAAARSGPESPAEPPQPQPDRDRASAAAAAESVPVGVPVGFGGGNMRLVEQLQLQRDDITFNGQDNLKQRFVNMGEEKMLLPLSGPRALGRVPRAAKQYLAKVANHKNDTPAEDECNSDSSEELQYGPGIVKKLKSKYLSMTLRESGSRPSLSSMRRATSLENLLDEEATVTKPSDTKPTQFVKRVAGNNTVKVVTHQSRSVEPSQRDMKRARSMETLLRYDPKLHMSHSNSGLNVHLEDVEKDENDACKERSYVQPRKSVEDEKEDQILLRKKLAITVEERELPPPDLVKQTLKIFESSGSPGPASPPVPQARTSVNKSNNFKTNNAKPVPKVKNSVSKKPQVSPKPVFSPEKLHYTKVTSSKKSVDVSEQVPISDSVSASLPCRNADASPVPSPVSPVSPLSSQFAPPTSAVTPIQVRSSTKRSPPSPRKTMGLPVLSPTEDKPPPIPRRDKSPSSSAPVTPGTPVTPLTPVSPSTPLNGNSNGRPESLDIRPIYSASDSDGEIDDVDAVTSKSVSSSALENIRKDGMSMQFSFGSNKSPSNDAAKSYLPRVKPTPPKDLPIPPKSTPTNCVRPMSPFESHNQDHGTPPASVINMASLPQGAVLKSPESPVQHAKQVGVIRPLVSTKQHHSPHNSSPSPATPTTLTNREIEKNLINRAKSIEQPVTKVVVSLKKLPDDVVVGSVSHSAIAFAVNGDQAGNSPAPIASKRGQAPGLWDKKPWHHQDNTMVFNFSNRKEVPDYIENDGLILRGNKREKQRVS